MKRIISMALILSVMLGIFMIVPVSASAAEDTVTKVLCKEYGEIYNETAVFYFSMPNDGKAELKFFGEDDDYNWTYGDANIYIYDEANVQLYSEYIYAYGNDKTFTFDLNAGNYSMKFETADEYDEFEYTFELNAKVPVTQAQNLKLNKTSATMNKGDSITLNPSWTNDDADGKESWKSSNTSVATVDNSGVVKAKGIGTADITFTKGSLSVMCKITVKEIKPNKVKLNKSKITLRVGKGYAEKYQLKATVSPSNADNKKVTWSSSNTKVATVNSSGKVVAKKAGKAVITVKTQSGNKVAKCTVTVKEIKPNKVKLNKNKLTLKIVGSQKDSYSLKATVFPKNSYNKNVTWSSSNTKVATVNSKGKVFAKSPGNAVIKVKTQSGKKVAKCNVTVKKIMPTKVKLNKTKITLYVGESYVEYYDLKATVYPEYSQFQKVTWSTSDRSVVTVNSKGRIEANKPGKAVITVKSKVGNKKTKCIVTVKKASVKHNFEEVRDYIQDYGSLNSDYNRFISFEYDGAKFGIVYEKSSKKLKFICTTDSGTAVTMKLSLKDNKTAVVDTIYANSYTVQAFKSTTTIDVDSYKKKQKLDILVYNDVYVDIDAAENLAQTSIDLAMLGWDILLDNEVGVELRDLGFDSYKR